jgi:flagellar capping protein FliD
MATDIIGALGAGSGVNVKALATSLVDAERVPREAAINTKIDDQNRKVSGYAALMLSLQDVKTAFQKLNDKTDFSSAQASVSDATILSAYTSSTAEPGRHSIEVKQLAAVQRTGMGSFATATTALNSGSALSVRLTINSVAQTSISVATDTPQGVVDAINAADQGVTAQLLDTGDGSSTPYRIVLSGPMGEDGVFSLSADDETGTAKVDTLTFGGATAAGTITVGGVELEVAAGDSAAEVATKVMVALTADDFLTGNTNRSVVDNADGTLTLNWAKIEDGDATAASFADTDTTSVSMTSATATAYVAGSAVSTLALDASNFQEAANATVDVNGLTLSRTNNVLDDAITGVYIDLLLVAVGTNVELRVTRDTTTITDNINNLVSAYNLAIADIATLTGARSEDEEDVYSGSLKGDSTVSLIKSQLRSMLISDSSTASGTMTAFRDVGLDIDRYGVMSINATTLSTALTNSFDDVVAMFSADTNSQTEVGTASRGIAGDAIVLINDLIDSRGTIASQSANATSRISTFEDQIAALETRMASLLARYTKQFAAMESMVGQTNTMRDSLKASFEGMMAMYTNK